MEKVCSNTELGKSYGIMLEPWESVQANLIFCQLLSKALTCKEMAAVELMSISLIKSRRTYLSPGLCLKSRT